jgi:hypothetical protein
MVIEEARVCTVADTAVDSSTNCGASSAVPIPPEAGSREDSARLGTKSSEANALDAVKAKEKSAEESEPLSRPAITPAKDESVCESVKEVDDGVKIKIGDTIEESGHGHVHTVAMKGMSQSGRAKQSQVNYVAGKNTVPSEGVPPTERCSGAENFEISDSGNMISIGAVVVPFANRQSVSSEERRPSVRVSEVAGPKKVGDSSGGGAFQSLKSMPYRSQFIAHATATGTHYLQSRSEFSSIAAIKHSATPDETDCDSMTSGSLSRASIERTSKMGEYSPSSQEDSNPGTRRAKSVYSVTQACASAASAKATASTSTSALSTQGVALKGAESSEAMGVGVGIGVGVGGADGRRKRRRSLCEEELAKEPLASQAPSAEEDGKSGAPNPSQEIGFSVYPDMACEENDSAQRRSQRQRLKSAPHQAHT